MEPSIALSTLIGEGILLGLSIAAPIGPVNIEAIRRGLRDGFLAAWMVGCGSTAADLFYVGLVYLGIAPLVTRPMFRIPLDLAAAAVLGTLAWQAFRDDPRRLPFLDGTEGEETRDIKRGALSSGFFITLSNPMTIVFYFSLFGGAVAKLHDAPRAMHLAYVGCVVVGCLLWSFLLALAAGWGKRKAGVRSLRIVGVASGSALTFFAAWFLREGVREIWKLLT